MSAAALHGAYRRGALSPVEATEAVLARIARWEPHIHALYALDAEAARAQARASEARWRAGEPLSVLDGVPCTIKENLPSRGVPVPLGTAATALSPAGADAPPVARLREAGCVLLAKTTMPDYGMLSSGLSSFHPTTRNPWQLDKTPGGSSAGAAAAAAALCAPLHLGTDIGGSIRLPAGWCGVVGLKPSLGRVPINAPYAGRVAGPITRSAQDAAMAMALLSRPDWRDATSLPPQDIAWDRFDEFEARGLRIGLWLDAGWGLDPAPEVLAAVRDAAQAFEREGAVVEELAPFSTRAMVEGLDRFWRMRFWLEMQSLAADRRARVLPYIRAWCEPAAAYGAAEVFRGHAQIAALRDATVAATQPYDLVLSPVSPVTAFAHDWASPLNDPARPFEHIGFTLPFNMSEQPALVLPCGTSASGLPIGLQIAGRRHDDLGVLRAAHAWERLRPPLPPWPEPSA